MEKLSLKRCFTADIGRVIENPGFRDYIQAFLFNPGYKAVVLYRLAYYFRVKKFPPFNKGIPFVSRALHNLCLNLTASDISYYAEIGDGFRIAHTPGVVIGFGVKIGKGVTIYSNVTLGARKIAVEGEGGGVSGEDGERYPIIEDDVVIYSGARIVGPVTIGKGSVVGANAVVLDSFPPGSTVVGVPARSVSRSDVTGDVD